MSKLSQLPGLEDALATLIDAADLLVVALDLEGRIELVNPHFLRVTGYRGEELLGSSWLQLSPEGMQLQEVLEAAVRDEARRQEYSIRAAGGGERLVSWNSVPRRGSKGELLGVLCIGSDMTEQRQAERQAQEALRELGLQKQALDEHAIVAVTDRSGRITYANDRFCHISGYAREELIGQDHRILNSGYHSTEFFKDLWGTVGRGQVWRGDICNRAKDGHPYWVKTTIVPFHDEQGRISSYVAIRAEITQQKEYEQSLSQLAAIVDSSADAIVREDLDGCITSWNPAAARIYGFSQAEALGQPVSMFVPPEAREDELRRRNEQAPFEAQHQTRKGRRIDVSVSIAPILDRQGATVGWARISRDITVQRRMQDRLTRAAKLAALGELAGNVAHEVNNPLGIISGKASLLLTGGYGFPEKVERELEKILEQSNRVSRLTRALLDYCRPSFHPKEPIDVHEPLRRALTFVESKAQRCGITIRDELLAAPPRIQANTNELEQVFLNLFLNALDAMEGGGTLTIRSRVEADGQAGGRAVLVVTIADTGEGIDPEVVPRVFEPFFTTKAGKGTGLGLAICWGLIRGHEGTIEVESAPGEGTVFTIRIPALAR